MRKLEELSWSLTKASRKKYYNPYEKFHWPETLPEDQWYFSPELLSIQGTEYYEQVSEAQLKKLSFYEAVNFFSLNIHGEKALVAGIASRLYKKWPPEISEYLHHFLDEENKHMTMFGTFCNRYASVYPDKKFGIENKKAAALEDFLFFVKVVIFEEIVDFYNVTMAADERINTLARDINRSHHEDETRHLAFGRKIVCDLFGQHKAGWSEQELQFINDYLIDYFNATWREYLNPGVYRDAGFKNSYGMYKSIAKQGAWLTHRRRVSEKCIQFLQDNQIILDTVENNERLYHVA